MTGSRRRRRGGTCHSVVGEGGQRWESQEEKKEGSRKMSEIRGRKETDETSPPSIDEQPNDPHTRRTTSVIETHPPHNLSEHFH